MNVRLCSCTYYIEECIFCSVWWVDFPYTSEYWGRIFQNKTLTFNVMSTFAKVYQTLTQNLTTLTQKMESFKSWNVNVTSTFWKAVPSVLYSWPAHWCQIQKLAKVNFKVLPKKHLKTSIFIFKTVGKHTFFSNI